MASLAEIRACKTGEVVVHWSFIISRNSSASLGLKGTGH